MHARCRNYFFPRQRGVELVGDVLQSEVPYVAIPPIRSRTEWDSWCAVLKRDSLAMLSTHRAYALLSLEDTAATRCVLRVKPGPRRRRDGGDGGDGECRLHNASSRQEFTVVVRNRVVYVSQLHRTTARTVYSRLPRIRRPLRPHNEQKTLSHMLAAIAPFLPAVTAAPPTTPPTPAAAAAAVQSTAPDTGGAEELLQALEALENLR